jgi:hypothetical protein
VYEAAIRKSGGRMRRKRGNKGGLMRKEDEKCITD